MQVKKIAALVAVACAGMSGLANAALPGSGTAGTPYEVVKEARAAGRIFYISGATATQAGFQGIINSLFSSSFRLSNTSGTSRDFEGAAGVMAVGPWAGQTAVIVDRIVGGSVWGVNPVARAEAIVTMHVHEDDCSGTGAGTTASPYICESTLTDGKPGVVSDAGISDVAPRHFVFPYNTEGETPAAALSPTELAEFSNTTYNKPIYALSFGVPVTNNISPKLTRASVAGIMAGLIGDWKVADPSLAASEDIVVCRRVQGSGTQAVDNLFFNNISCTAQFNEPAARDATSAWDPVTGNYTIADGSGYQVIENSTSGDVRNCLLNAAKPGGGSYTTTDRNGLLTKTVTFEPKAGGHKAIGVLSMDSLTSSNGTSATGWSFRSLDGVGRVACADVAGCPANTDLATTSGTGKFPLEESLADGTWELQGWISWNVPNRTIANAAKAGVAAEFVKAAQDPAVLDSINNLKNVALALPAPFSSYSGVGVSTAQYVGGNQCNSLFVQ